VVEAPGVANFADTASGCTQINAQAVRCNRASGFTRVDLRLEERADTAFIDPLEQMTASIEAGDDADVLISNIPVLMKGGDGNDQLFADNPDSDLLGQAGDDLIEGGGDDRIEGDNGNDTLRGEDGNDFIEGDEGVPLTGGGADTLDGGAGDDELQGGNDHDTLVGGSGLDQHKARTSPNRPASALLVTLDEPSDRRVIRPLLRRDHPKRDILLTGAFDRPRRRHPPRVRVEQQRDHHRRVIGRPAAAVDAIGRVERIEIHLGDGIDHESREVIHRQPLADIRRHQERLLTITRDKALSRLRIALNPPDATRHMRQPQAIAKARAVRERGAACRHAHAVAMQTPGTGKHGRADAPRPAMLISSLPAHSVGRKTLKRPGSTSWAQARSSSNPYRSMEGGSVDELLDVTVERPVLDQLQVEVRRTLEDRVQPGLTGDDREERHLQEVD
jgi:hypothetical protein